MFLMQQEKSWKKPFFFPFQYYITLPKIFKKSPLLFNKMNKKPYPTIILLLILLLIILIAGCINNGTMLHVKRWDIYSLELIRTHGYKDF
jgi:hypothetical protein